MTDSFDVHIELRLAGDEPQALHQALAEQEELVLAHAEVEGVVFGRDGRTERVELYVRAADEADAAARASSILDAVEAAVAQTAGADAVERVQLEVAPAPAMLKGLYEQLEQIRAQASAIAPGPAGAPGPEHPIDAPYRVMLERDVQTDELDAAAIADWFRAREERARFHFVSIEPQHLSVVFDALPDDLETFVAEAYDFCPDLMNDCEELDELDLEDDDRFDRLAIEAITRALRETHRLNFAWS